MSSSKIKKSLDTYNKLNDIISASKLKVLNKMTTVKKFAGHNYMAALVSKRIFEQAKNKYNFTTEIYENNFNTNKNINVVFFDEKQTLSHSYERIMRQFLNNKKENDLNIIVAETEIKDERIDDIRQINLKDLMNLSHEISHQYVTKKYDRVQIYSSLTKDGSPTTILPIGKLDEVSDFKYDSIINPATTFIPSVEMVIEKSFLDYVKNLILYFHFYGRYTNLKNTLLKHESSLDHLSEKLDDLKRQMNKIRQAKLTEEIMLAFQEVDDD